MSKRGFSFEYEVSTYNQTSMASGSHNCKENSILYGEMDKSDVSNVLKILDDTEHSTYLTISYGLFGFFGSYKKIEKHPKTMYDIGMGAGKVILQTFEERSDFNLFVGIELLSGRYKIAAVNLKRFSAFLDKDEEVSVCFTEDTIPCNYCKMTVTYLSSNKTRTIIFYNDDILNSKTYYGISQADIVIFAMNLVEERYGKFADLLLTVKSTCKGYSYKDIFTLPKIYITDFRRIKCTETFSTDWSRNGHFWKKK